LLSTNPNHSIEFMKQFTEKQIPIWLYRTILAILMFGSLFVGLGSSTGINTNGKKMGVGSIFLLVSAGLLAMLFITTLGDGVYIFY